MEQATSTSCAGHVIRCSPPAHIVRRGGKSIAHPASDSSAPIVARTSRGSPTVKFAVAATEGQGLRPWLPFYDLWGI
jgi:hypothetical protein